MKTGRRTSFAGLERSSMSEPRRVLLAEADSISAQLLSFSLEREGFEVTQARGGNEALRLARAQHFDIVLAEAVLPGIDGLELARQLRGHWNTRRIPIILVTTLGSTEERITGLRAGADEYLTKPYDVRELVIRLNRLVATYSNCHQLHPVTRLPGSRIIELYIEEACKWQRQWSVLQADINHFGTYNKLYGFDAGDQVLRYTADLLREIVLAGDAEASFVGHDGKDDFLAVLNSDRVKQVCADLIGTFDKEAGYFYPPEHRDNAYQVLVDRRGQTHFVPRLSLSVGVLTSDLCEDLSYLELREAAGEVLRRAKADDHSSVYVNRRHLVGREMETRRAPGGAQPI